MGSRQWRARKTPLTVVVLRCDDEYQRFDVKGTMFVPKVESVGCVISK